MNDYNLDIERVLFSPQEISNRIKEIGEIISRDYEGKNPLIVGILKGSVVFLADLIRNIDIPCEIDFMSISSYDMNAVSSGKIKIKKDLDTNIDGRHVIIAEDILDTALTLKSVAEMLEKRDPASLKTAVLLNKKAERKIDFKADYKCFDVENEFIVGFGLDYAQKYRNLPYIGILKSEIYQNK